MRKTAFSLALLTALPAVALPCLDAVHDEDGELIMALDNAGRLYELKQTGWMVVGEPCPTPGPYSFELVEMPELDDTVFIFVVDGTGGIYQTDGINWIETLPPPDGAVKPCLGALFHPTTSGVDTLVVDSVGYVFVNESATSWRAFASTLPAAPRDLEVFFEVGTLSAHPFVLAEDNHLYGYIDDDWGPSETFDFSDELNRLEIHVYTDTGNVLLLCLDDDGRLYDNNATGELALSGHEPCPGEGPWEIKLLHINDGFDLLCLDAVGRLFMSADDTWESMSDPFPVTESE